MQGQHICLATGKKDFGEKWRWFAEDAFLALGSVKPAFEWKGPLDAEAAGRLNHNNLYWGIHLPNNLAFTYATDPAKAEQIVRDALDLKPNYVVVHGGPADHEAEEELPEWPERLFSPISAKAYIHWLQNQLGLLKYITEWAQALNHNFEVLLENTSPTEFVIRDGQYTLPTYLFPRIGNWLETAAVASMEGASALCDIGHLTFARNYFCQQDIYTNLHPFPTFTPHDEHESFCWNRLGLGIRKGHPMIAKELYCDMGNLIGHFGARHYHLDGSISEETDVKVEGAVRVDSHAPLRFGSARDREIVSYLRGQGDVLVCPEVDGRSCTGGPFDWRSQETLEVQYESFIALCQLWAFKS